MDRLKAYWQILEPVLLAGSWGSVRALAWRLPWLLLRFVRRTYFYPLILLRRMLPKPGFFNGLNLGIFATYLAVGYWWNGGAGVAPLLQFGQALGDFTHSATDPATPLNWAAGLQGLWSLLLTVHYGLNWVMAWAISQVLGAVQGLLFFAVLGVLALIERLRQLDKGVYSNSEIAALRRQVAHLQAQQAAQTAVT